MRKFIWVRVIKLFILVFCHRFVVGDNFKDDGVGCRTGNWEFEDVGRKKFSCIIFCFEGENFCRWKSLVLKIGFFADAGELKIVGEERTNERKVVALIICKA